MSHRRPFSKSSVPTRSDDRPGAAVIRTDDNSSLLFPPSAPQVWELLHYCHWSGSGSRSRALKNPPKSAAQGRNTTGDLHAEQPGSCSRHSGCGYRAYLFVAVPSVDRCALHLLPVMLRIGASPKASPNKCVLRRQANDPTIFPVAVASHHCDGARFPTVSLPLHYGDNGAKTKALQLKHRRMNRTAQEQGQREC